MRPKKGAEIARVVCMSCDEARMVWFGELSLVTRARKRVRNREEDNEKGFKNK
jgi:hypothetical protein